MEILFIYILKSSGLIALFYAAYYLLLQKETFFNSNRWFLLAGLFTSALLPLMVYTTIIWVESTPINTINWSKIPATRAIDKEIFEINWNLIILGAYTLGILLFLIQFSFDFYNLNQVLKGKKFQQLADHKFIDLKENVAPFSFFNTIVYNSSLYNESEMESILEHEKVHSDQFHTIDVLIARLFCILFWFNPFIWLYKKAMLQNLEFIADSEATKNIYDKKAYQLTLLKITTHENCVAITNHFYQSLIKKRIVMLNKNQSKKWNSWKYALILPVLVAFVVFFQMKVVAQEKASTKTEITKLSEITISKSSTDAEIKNECEKLKKEQNIDLTFTNIKRNSKEEITSINASFNDNKGSIGNYSQTKDEPISTFKFTYDESKNDYRKIGFNSNDANSESYTYDNEDTMDIVEARELPTPPTPPTPPSAPNFTNIPVPTVKMPALPKPPRVPSNMNDEKAMKQFDQDMEAYDKKMEKLQPQIDHFEKKMEEYQSKMEALNPDMEKFDKEMEKFDEEMSKFDEEMAKFDQKMTEYHDQMASQNMKIEKTIVKTNKKVKK